ncbi:hypothetical protein HZQ54_18655 [Elizabethkingia anophelis]|nr:hypothetical protein [Elizabethkingia anophelis]MCT4156602.1 hypothetical protein [Elizabethkingia anophelis]
MEIWKGKNDYSLRVYNRGFIIVEMPFVNNCYKASVWLTQSFKYKNWTHFEAYNRRSGEYIGTFNRDMFIPPYPRF